jgi:hypothetical protein
MGWSIYRPEFTTAARLFREQLRQDKPGCSRLFGQPLKRVPHERLETEVWRTLFCDAMPGLPPLEAAVLLDENIWCREGRHIFFPVPGLLPRLYRAKIDVTVDEFRMPRSSFIFALPADETFGDMALPSCLVGCWDWATKQKHVHWLEEQFGMLPVHYSSDSTGGSSLFFSVLDRQAATAIRWSIPLARLAPVLACGPDSPEEFEQVIGLYPAEMGSLPVARDEQRMQYRLTKLLAALCIYLRACPDALVDGVPPPAQGLVPRFSKGHEVGRKHIDAERNRPIGHWREWHFRRYPLQRNGSRREGVVFVTGAWVSGREQLHTVNERNPA